MAVMPVTNVVSMDEPCVLLYEANGPALDSTSPRRWRHIRVIRDDAPAEYVEDMGRASAFGDEINIPGGDPDKGIHGIVETVGRLIDFANELKLVPFDAAEVVTADLIGGYHDIMEQRRRVLNGERP